VFSAAKWLVVVIVAAAGAVVFGWNHRVETARYLLGGEESIWY
jgi:hypothetical protein